MDTKLRYRKTDRQTDILLTEIKVITDLFVIVIREIYAYVYGYKNVNLSKSYDNIHGMTNN